jgi:large subunit ribosomal protein L4
MADERLTLPVLSGTAKPVGQIEVPAALLTGPARTHLLYEAVRSQLANRRAGTAATKTRGFVSGGGKKPWRQKGTGRARAGSIRSPVWAGGGTIFGPQPRDYGYRLPKSARRAALRAALADRHAGGALIVVDGVKLPEAKTKHMLAWLRGMKLGETSVLIVLADHDHAVERAARNLPRVKVLLAAGLNVYDVLGHERLVITRAALAGVVARLEPESGGTA